ncbi:MAG: sortase [Chloroflexi bacterium]|nr:MAG: sortase [Chloroflexota bacterium]
MVTTPTTNQPQTDRSGPRIGGLRAIGTLTILIGMLFAGASWAVLSDREGENQQTFDRIATIQANQTPAFPIGVVPPTPTEGGAPTPTLETTSADVPLLQPIDPTPTPPAAPTPAATREVTPPAPTSTPWVLPTPVPDMPPPTHISIPAVGIDTEVVQVSSYTVVIQGVTVLQWNVADWAAGHHDTSASPGENGNIVIAGHDDYRGEVFRGLHDAEIGDDVYLTSAAGTFHYTIREIHLRKEKGVELGERLATGLFMGPMPEERLTLITCWPYGVDDHRMIIVAKPAVADTGTNAP